MNLADEDEAKRLAIGGLVPVAFNLECEARTDSASDMDIGAKSDVLQSRPGWG